MVNEYPAKYMVAMECNSCGYKWEAWVKSLAGEAEFLNENDEKCPACGEWVDL